ncbi:MAG: endonuclease [Candidatus Moraniibacteriota bacterium]|nr:MAG: endonuclease [Candidatus Moranbacteria bacterium]
MNPNIYSDYVESIKNGVYDGETKIEVGDVGVLKNRGENESTIFFIRVWRECKLCNDDFSVIDIEKVGDAFDKKICNVCHKLKKTSEFARNQNGINNRTIRRPSCRDCRVIMEGKAISSADRIKWLKIKPRGVPYECPVCKKRTIAGVTSKVVLEHDHKTGKPGGWICDSCNTGLGRFKDNVSLLENAIEFIKKNY